MLAKALAAGAALLLAALPAAADVTVCNDDPEETIWVAFVADVPKSAFTNQWTLQGWYDVPGGECRDVIASPFEHTMLFSIMKTGPDGNRLIFLEHEPGGGTEQAEAIFCINDGPFTWTSAYVSDFEACRNPDNYRQLFNFRLKVPSQTNYTLRVG